MGERRIPSDASTLEEGSHLPSDANPRVAGYTKVRRSRDLFESSRKLRGIAADPPQRKHLRRRVAVHA